MVEAARALMRERDEDWTAPPCLRQPSAREYAEGRAAQLPHGARDALVREVAAHVAGNVIRRLPELRNELVEWVVNAAVNGQRFESEVVDSGFDVSDLPRATGEPHRLTEHDRVEDFLEQPNGETCATYCSGHGLTCDTLMTDFEAALLDGVLRLTAEEISTMAAAAGRGEVLSHEARAWLGQVGPADIGDITDEATERIQSQVSTLSAAAEDLLNRPLADLVVERRPEMRARVAAERREAAAAEDFRLAAYAQSVRLGDRLLDLIRDHAFFRDRIPPDADHWPDGLSIGHTEDERFSLLHVLGRSVRTRLDAAALGAFVRGEPLRRITTKAARRALAEMATDIWSSPVAMARLSAFERAVPGGAFPANARSAFARIFHWLDEEWARRGTHFFVTVSWTMRPEKHATFSRDNWEWYRRAALDVETDPSDRISIVVRRFEPLRHADSGLPHKSVGGAICEAEHLMGLSGEQMALAASVHPETGKALPREPAVTYKDFDLIVRLTAAAA